MTKQEFLQELKTSDYNFRGLPDLVNVGYFKGITAVCKNYDIMFNIVVSQHTKSISGTYTDAPEEHFSDINFEIDTIELINEDSEVRIATESECKWFVEYVKDFF